MHVGVDVGVDVGEFVSSCKVVTGLDAELV